jgi:AraC family transcriptional regulator of adaptative response/methylated-DNA-[protein]-cysteine methyltransferase
MMEAWMHSIDFSQHSRDYQRIEKAIGFITKRFKSQPSLDQIAASVYLSRYHFDRLFKRWAGISPIQFMHFLTLDFSKQKLAEAGSLLHTALDAGLSGPGRLHDLFVNFEAMTPGEFKTQGAGLNIEYGFSPTPFGLCLLATTGRGICYLGFVSQDRPSEALKHLKKTWSGAAFSENPSKTQTLVGSIFSKERQDGARPFNLLLKGTNFQIQVWKALLSIPEGWVVSYQDVAAYVGSPKALRAVANAVAINPVAYLIPCHRVIAKSGKTHGYRWGAVRKKAIIGWEAAMGLSAS